MNFEVKTVNQIKYYFYLHYLFLRRHVKSSRPEMYYRKGVVKNFSKFTGKYLCQSISSIQVVKF